MHKLSEPTRIAEEFDAYAPDLGITDIEMPEMDGIELVERFRSHLSRDTCLPSLVLTGSPEPRHKRCARAVGAQYLKGDRHRVMTASDGGEALQRVMSEHFALVITDHGMPGMSGVQIADSVRRNALAKHVILLTGFAHDPAQQPASVNCVLKNRSCPMNCALRCKRSEKALASGCLPRVLYCPQEFSAPGSPRASAESRSSRGTTARRARSGNCYASRRGSR